MLINRTLSLLLSAYIPWFRVQSNTLNTISIFWIAAWNAGSSNLPDDGLPYFFSSQLLMDLDALRAQNATQKLIETTLSYSNSLVYPDQDVINAVFRGNITPIGQEYNVIPAYAIEEELAVENIRQAYSAPVIVHFASIKPNILTGPRNSLEKDFFHFWQHSPWRRHIPYPLVSFRRLPKGLSALFYSIIRLLLPCPRLLQALGSVLNRIRKSC